MDLGIRYLSPFITSATIMSGYPEIVHNLYT